MGMYDDAYDCGYEDGYAESVISQIVELYKSGVDEIEDKIRELLVQRGLL